MAGTFTSCAKTDLLFSRESASDAAELYLQGHTPEHPLASPVFGDLAAGTLSRPAGVRVFSRPTSVGKMANISFCLPLSAIVERSGWQEMILNP